MATRSVDKPGASERASEPESPAPSPHDAFFKQTFSDVDLAGQFLRERLPPELAALFESVDPVLCEAEFVKHDLTKRFADKVLGLPPCGARNYWVYFVLEAKTKGRRGDILQLREYCNAIIDRWRARAARQDPELQGQSEQAPVTVPMIIYSGQSKYNYPTELWQMSGRVPVHQRQFMLSPKALLVDLSTIEDDDLSKDIVLRARLLALKHGTDPDLTENPEKHLAAVLKDVPRLQMPHSSAIIRYMGNLVPGGKQRVEEALTRITSKEEAERFMIVTDAWVTKEMAAKAMADARAEVRAEAEAMAAKVKAMAEAKAEAMAKAKAEVMAKAMAKAMADAWAEAKGKAPEDVLRQILIVAVEQRLGAFPADARERVAAASAETLAGWLSEIVLNNSVDWLRNTLLASGSGTHMNGADVPEPPKP